MIKPALPPKEELRLRKLWDYSILDSLPEEDFDSITELASMICEVPISLISFVDEDRQWFKSNRGLKSKETPREVSFCAHAINTPNELFQVKDATKDERFQDNPLVEGKPNIVFYAGIPLVDSEGHALGTLCVIDNKPRALSKEQQSALESLSRQVINLLELRRSKSELEVALKFVKFKNKELEEFTYITSHDLQEPVRTIVSLIEMISESYEDELDERGQEMMKYVVSAGYRMKALILGLLDYSRLGREKAVTKIICIELLDEVLKDLSASIEESKAEVIIEPLPIIKGHRTEMRLLFQNLLSNALKFRRKNTSPVINVSCSDQRRNWEFCISDNGIGIPAKNKTQIFKIFQRLHGRSEYEGYGLGLTHCRKIIELHQGKIWVKSQMNKGSQFYFTIPKSL